MGSVVGTGGRARRVTAALATATAIGAAMTSVSPPARAESPEPSTVTLIAGGGTVQHPYPDGTLATDADLGTGGFTLIATSVAGTYFTADVLRRIYRLTPDGTIEHIGGNGGAASLPLPSPTPLAPDVPLGAITSLAALDDGTVYLVSEGSLQRISPSKEYTRLSPTTTTRSVTFIEGMNVSEASSERLTVGIGGGRILLGWAGSVIAQLDPESATLSAVVSMPGGLRLWFPQPLPDGDLLSTVSVHGSNAPPFLTRFDDEGRVIEQWPGGGPGGMLLWTAALPDGRVVALEDYDLIGDYGPRLHVLSSPATRTVWGTPTAGPAPASGTPFAESGIAAGGVAVRNGKVVVASPNGGSLQLYEISSVDPPEWEPTFVPSASRPLGSSTIDVAWDAGGLASGDAVQVNAAPPSPREFPFLPGLIVREEGSTGATTFSPEIPEAATTLHVKLERPDTGEYRTVAIDLPGFTSTPSPLPVPTLQQPGAVNGFVRPGAPLRWVTAPEQFPTECLTAPSTFTRCIDGLTQAPASDGTYTMSARVYLGGSGVAGQAQVCVDGNGPVSSIASVSRLTLTPSGSTVRTTWSASDAKSGVARYEVRTRTRKGEQVSAWFTPTALRSTTARSATFSVARGTSRTFQVRSVDKFGNVGAWSTARTVSWR